MSPDVLTYFLKVAMLTMAFALMFHLLVRKDTFHRVGRVVLVLSLMMAYVLPFCRITRHVVQELPQDAANQLTAYQTERSLSMETQVTQSAVTDAAVSAQTNHLNINWRHALLITYLAGVLFVLCRISFCYLRVRSIIKRSKTVSKGGELTVLTSKDNIQPFSWMNYVVLPTADLNNSAILAHEKVHVSLHHSRELLLVDLLSVFQWFNPAIWMLRRDLCSLHEYEADAGVLALGYDMDAYQDELIGRAIVAAPLPYTNSFHASSLRERILMINRRDSKPRVLFKLAYLPAVAAVWFFATAMTVYDPVVKESENINLGPNWGLVDRYASFNAGLEQSLEEYRQSPEFQAYLAEMHKPIESAPVNGGRVNGHVLDIDGKPIKYRAIRACERDNNGNLIREWSASGDDGFFDIQRIEDIGHRLSFEAEGFETQTFPFDRGTYEVRLKPVAVTLKSGDVVSGWVTLDHWANPGGVLVEEIDRNGKVVGSTYTDQGQFSLTIVKPGNTLKVSTKGFTTFSVPLEISNYIIVLMPQ